MEKPMVETVRIYMMDSGEILLQEHGESFGYLNKPLFLRIPVKEVEIAREWICETERGVIYLQKDKKKEGGLW
jgi:hypothetical protein